MNRFGAISMTALLLIGAIAGFFSPVAADIEPNDTFLTAEVLATGTPMSGTINDTDTDDYYKFNVINGQKIHVELEVTAGPDDIWAYLYDTTQNSIGETDYVNPGTSDTIDFTTSQHEAGFYFVQVEGGTAAYVLTVTLTDQDDAGSGMDAGDTDAEPYPITPGTITGWIADRDEADYYSFAVVDAQMITVTMTTGTTDTDDLWFYVYGPDKNSIGSSDYLNPGVSETWEYTTSVATAGTYYIEVEGGKNDYTVELALADQNDADQGIDASDTDTAPTMADLAVEHEGWIADDDEYDYYGFNVVDGQKIIFTMKTGTDGTDDLWAEIYGPDKGGIRSTDYLNPDVSETIEFTTSYATAGLYYVEVTGGKNNYFITFSVEDQDDANSGIDANDDFPVALAVLEGNDMPGWIANDDEYDFYKVNVTNGQTIDVTLTTGTADTDDLWMALYDPQKTSLGETDYLNPEISETISYTTSYETPGFYYYKVTGGANSYTVDLDLIDQDDAGTGMDAPATLVDAVALIEGQYTGWVADADEVDAYNFTVKAGNIFTINVTNDGTTDDLTVEIFNPQKNSIKVMYANPGVTQSFSLPVANVPTAHSSFFVEIRGDGHAYTIDLKLPTAPPDTTPPTVDIKTPADMVVFMLPAVVVTGTATDDGTVTKVVASLDNATWVDCTGEGAWTCSLTLVDGSNKVYVKATDKAGNAGYDEITIRIDGTAPTVTITSTTNGSKVKKSALTLSGTAADNIGLDKVMVSVNGGMPVEANGTGTWSVDLTLTKGDNIIIVMVYDTAGNIGTETLTITYKKAKKEGGPGFEGVVLVGAVLVVIALMGTRRRKD